MVDQERLLALLDRLRDVGGELSRLRNLDPDALRQDVDRVRR
ncbi:MAG TPA: hypothetical protein VK906_02300 [Egicoccus sp.]|nr:hypothetical protein [Egicoccus sp.]